MKKIAILLLFITFNSTWSYAQSSFIPSPPQLYSRAWLLMDYETGTVLTEHRGDLQLAPASLTKIMTHYLVASELAEHNLNLNDKIRVSTNAWRKGNSSTGSSSMFLRERQLVTIEDLLKGLVVQSGNDAAIALAEHIADSEAGFVEMMNQQAAILGMTNTEFKNSSGWPAEGHLSTARDLGILSAALIRNFPENYKIHKVKNFSFNGIAQQNRNLLLWQDNSVDGVKTGSTDESGHSVIISAKRKNMRYIAVILGNNSKNRRFEEAKRLLSWGFRHYITKTLYKKNEEILSKRVWKGQKKIVSIGFAKDVKLSLPRHENKDMELINNVNDYIEAPVRKGQIVGKSEFILDGKKIYEENLVILETIDKGSFFARLWDRILYAIHKISNN